jgi:sugar fermentation stimulation protein A
LLHPASLVPATLIARYKRFLADVRLDTGETVTAHVANSGAMTGLNRPGMRVFLARSDDPKRKLAWSLQLVEADDGRGPTLVGIDTSRPNGIVAEAIRAGRVPALAGYDTLRREVRYGANSRIDILLSGPGRPDAYVEVKNVHLVRCPGLAEFPDSVTTRGAKHLAEMSAMVAAGHRAVMVWFVHRADCDRLAFAADIDPAYAAGVARAVAAGVETLVLTAEVTLEGTWVAGEIPVAIPAA